MCSALKFASHFLSFNYTEGKTKCSRGSKDGDGEMRYNPFRITPYQLKVRGAGEEEEPCCLALAERIISGYEGAGVILLNVHQFVYNR